MYKVLVVDDEAFITDGLYRLLQNLPDLSLEVYRAYSARVALDLLKKYRMDIVITDINMPGLSGLDMLHEIQIHWPQCRTIILSGYNNFSYAQQAITYGADFYLLKTDGDEVLLDAVNQCIQKIEASAVDDQWKEKAEMALKKALPLLQQEYLFHLLNEELPPTESINETFHELSIPLCPFSPVFLAGVRLDNISAPSVRGSFSYYIAAIFDLFQKASCKKLNSISVALEDPRYSLWIFQPSGDFASSDIIPYVNGVLETIQKYVQCNLKTSISFLIEPKEISFTDLPGTYHNLHFILTHKLNPDEEMVLGTPEFYMDYSSNSDFSSIHSSCQLLEQYFMQRNKTQFFSVFENLLSKMMNFQQPELQIFIYHKLSAFFLEMLIETDKKESFLETFYSMEIFSTPYNQWDIRLYDKFLSIAKWLFQIETDETHMRYQQMITIIHNYIKIHLKENISLTSIAEQVYLNPVYLSRIYKQITGETLSQYITQCRLTNAKELLKNSQMKINEIAYEVGYESPAHFSRVFKKFYGSSPQEYRNISAN